MSRSSPGHGPLHEMDPGQGPVLGRRVGGRLVRTELRVGLAVVATYLAVAWATSTWAPGQMRPLFDGFGSHPGAYHWVNPPREFAEGNQPPTGAEAGIATGPEGFRDAGAATQDSQALVSIQRGSLPPHPPDTSAVLKVNPLDSSGLGALPTGLRPEGNVYRVVVEYLPSRTPAMALTKPGTLILTSVAPADALLFSKDGDAWTPLEAGPLQQGTGLTAEFDETGFYLVAGKGEPRPTTAATDGGSSVALYVVLAAPPLIIAMMFVAGRRRGRDRGRPTTRRPVASGPQRRTSYQSATKKKNKPRQKQKRQRK